MLKKANYKPTLPIFGDGFLEGRAKSVRFDKENHTQQQQYDSLYDNNMKDYFNRPNIKKRLVELGLTDNNGNPVVSRGQERNAIKKKQLLKEREEVVKKIRIREADRISRLAANSNKVTKSCVACETRNRVLSYLRNHTCPVHSNVTYQRAKETLNNSVARDVLSNEDDLATLEAENKTLKNLWYNEVLRMEEEALQQQLQYEKRRLQQVLSELKKLKQHKEVSDVESLDEIKINLYSKIKRRLGLQALLTTLREVDDTAYPSLYDKAGLPVDTDDTQEWSLPPQLNRLGLSFQYFPPQPPSLTPADPQCVRPSSAPVKYQQVKNPSELSLRQSFNEQLKKRPTSSRGHRTTDNGPYSRSLRQTTMISQSPLVSYSSLTGVPQQFSDLVKSNSSLVNGAPICKEDVDDDSMPMDEAEAVLEGLSDIEISQLSQCNRSDESIRDKLPHGQAYSDQPELANHVLLTNPASSIPKQRSFFATTSKTKQLSEKKVSFIDAVPPSAQELMTDSSKELTTEQTQIINDGASREQSLSDARLAEAIEDLTADVTKDCSSSHSLPQTASQTATKSNNENISERLPTITITSPQSSPQTSTTNGDKGKVEGISTTVTNGDKNTLKVTTTETNGNMEKPINTVATPQPSYEVQVTTNGDNTPKEMEEEFDLTNLEQLMDAASLNKPIKNRSASMPPGRSRISNNTSLKKLNTKSSKSGIDSKVIKTKQSVKQTSRKPRNNNQDWKKAILQSVKK